MTDIELLPRADLPVIWDAFKAQAEEFRETAETLVVTDVSQKDLMELACRTRLTLRKIRIAVEHKRVELGEGHLKEIQKVNGAAKAIREFIEPLEARLLVQESFAERVEEDRITELTKTRNDEVNSIRLGADGSNIGRISQASYDTYVARLRAEKAELESANRLRVEAEKRLAERQAEVEQQRKENAALLKAQQDAADAEVDRKQAEIDAGKTTIAAFRRERLEAEAVARAERAKEQARLDAELAIRNADLAEQKRIRDEQFAKLEAELAQERAAKQAEADAARRLALAPDMEKLQGYLHALLLVPIPSLENSDAKRDLQEVVDAMTRATLSTNFFLSSKV